MPRTLTAADRSLLIKLASSMPVGSPERKAILKGLSKTAGKSELQVAFPSDVKSDFDKLYDRLSRYYDLAKRERGPEMKNHLMLMKKLMTTAVSLNAELHRAEESLYY